MIKDRKLAGISCNSCHFSHLCISRQFSKEERERMDGVIQKVCIVNKGEHIYRSNDKVDYVYALHTGIAKDYYVDENGQEYINNFYFPGDVLALEALPQKKFSYSAIALSDTTLCMIPIASLYTEMLTFPALLKRFLEINSYKMMNDKHIRPTTNAKQRVADFLVNMLYRLEERNGKRESFQLPMSQVDMSYMLGMAYETVSRVLHYFEEIKVIQIKNRHITIIDSEQLLSLGNDTKNLGQPLL